MSDAVANQTKRESVGFAGADGARIDAWLYRPAPHNATGTTIVMAHGIGGIKSAGLAPIANDSGKHNGRRTVRGRRSGVRSILFVVADLVRRHNDDFADCHRRLALAGKPKKVIRIALARKLLVRLNAKARDVRRQLANAA